MTDPTHIQVRINGSSRPIDASTSVADLVEQLDLQGKRIAIELNQQILQRSRYAETRLKDGDRLEIVGAIGGG